MPGTFLAVLNEYRYNDDVFCDDDTFMRRIKRAIWLLAPADRNILIYYADCQSMAKTAEKLGVSKSTIINEVKRIRQLIIESL